MTPCLGQLAFPLGCAYPFAMGAKEADDEASCSTAGNGLVSPIEVPRCPILRLALSRH
jgi:hypothetical protein